MNKSQLFTRAIEKSLKDKKGLKVITEEFSREWIIPVEFSHQGKQVVLDICFKAACQMNGDIPVTVYEETVRTYKDKNRQEAKVEPARFFILKQKFDDQTVEDLVEMFDGVQHEFSYTKGDLTRFKKSQVQTETSTDETVPVEKRGRGRPRKIVEASDVAVVAVEKRGRGRPKKVHTEQFVPMVEVSAISQ